MSHLSSLSPLWLLLWTFALLLGIGVLRLKLSRWPELARRYPGGEQPEGRSLHRQVLSMGRTSELFMTTLVPTAAGLYFYSFPLFRFRRPPILVPWSVVRHTSEREMLGRRWHVLDLGGVTVMRVKEPAWQAMAAYIPSDASTAA
jgi:hypothetical protein